MVEGGAIYKNGDYGNSRFEDNVQRISFGLVKLERPPGNPGQVEITSQIKFARPKSAMAEHGGILWAPLLTPRIEPSNK
jgi:hypothetical protein